MAVGAAPQIVDDLELRHPGVSFDIQIVAKAQRRGQIVLSCPLSDLAKTLNANEITGEAMLFVRWTREAHQADIARLSPSKVGDCVL
jgi:uroporphyrin-III C-methyltransferase/precorrin-2 dehydrogenase/sirohydrochlorin ferrochelatase